MVKRRGPPSTLRRCRPQRTARGCRR
jgi:hypothetical protein